MKKMLTWAAKVFFTMFLMFVVMPLLFICAIGLLPTAFEEGAPESEHLVAVVELKGMILDVKDVLQELYRQADNKKVKGIVFRIDSPGGAVGPSQEIYSAVKKIKEKKPVVVSMGAVAASGGLYSALPASKIYAQPGTLTGSIGVIMQLPNFRKITEKVGFDMVTIKSGALKDAGNSFRDMTEPERQYLQSTIDVAASGFIDAVAEGRNLKRADVLKFADGRIILGSEAVKLGLIDEIGDLDDAARAVFTILGKPLADTEKPDLYYPGDKFQAFRDLVGAASKIGAFFDEGRIEMMYLM